MVDLSAQQHSINTGNVFCWRRLLTSLQHGYISSRQQYKNKLVPSSTFLHCVGHFTDSVLQTRLVEFILELRRPSSFDAICCDFPSGKRNCSPKERRPACSIQSWHAKSSASRAHFHWRDRICKQEKTKLFLHQEALLLLLIYVFVGADLFIGQNDAYQENTAIFSERAAGWSEKD